MRLSNSVKKTSFDNNYNNRENQSKSSTYRLQTGIELTQRSINMSRKSNEKGLMGVESE